MKGWLKRLREKLRRKRPALLLGSLLFLLVSLGGITGYIINLAEAGEEPDSGGAKSALAPRQVEVILQKLYVVGPMSEERRFVPAEEIERLKQEYRDWERIAENENQIVFRKQLNDISPVLKEKGVFSIRPDGTLAVFEGDPEENKVIQTFFQLDLKRLETELPREEYLILKNGIRFSSLAEYHSILSTFGEFAVSDE